MDTVRSSPLWMLKFLGQMILGCIKVLARGKPLSSIVSALELCFELLPWFLPVMDGGLEGALFMLFVITTEKQTRTDPCLGGFHTKEVARPGLRLTPKPLPFAFFLCHFNSQLGPQSPENGIKYTVIMPGSSVLFSVVAMMYPGPVEHRMS